jgi:two-component system chemotaxis response regulator CheY
VPDDASSPLAGFCVFVVDDDEDCRFLIAHTMLDAGADVVQAGCATAATEIAENRRFDAIVADLTLGDMDGLELAQHLRRGRDGRSVALIAVSGLGKAYEARARSAGYDAYVVKPFDPHALPSVVLRAIEGRRRQMPS